MWARLSSPEMSKSLGPTLSSQGEGHIEHAAKRGMLGPGGVQEPWHACTHLTRKPGDPVAGLEEKMARGPCPEPERGKRAMNGNRKSDGPVVPERRSNNDNGAPWSAEGVEGRGSAKGNRVEQTKDRTQRRVPLPSALDRIRQVAERSR